MLDWRYLTTVPSFIGMGATLYRNELWVSGYWGPADGLCDREAYAPVVRISKDGDLAAPCAWPAPGLAEYEVWLGEDLWGPGIDRTPTLASWQDKLWVSGWRYGPDGHTARLMSFDGEQWLTEGQIAGIELLPLGNWLMAAAPGGLMGFDGATLHTVLTHVFALRCLRKLDDGRMVCTGDLGANANVFLVSYENNVWQVEQGPHPTADITSGSHWRHQITADMVATWRGKLWCTASEAQSDGSYKYNLAWAAPGGLAGGWEPVWNPERGRPMPVIQVRNQLYLYEDSEAYMSFGTWFEHFDGTWWAALFDGRTVEVSHPCQVVPYRVVPLENGGAVAFCRTGARREYYLDLLRRGHREWPPTALRHTYPDTDTLVYVVWPKEDRPPILPNGDLDGTVEDVATDPIQDAEVRTGDLYDLTDALGDYEIGDIVTGRHIVGAGKSGYQAQSAEVSILDGATTTQDFTLPALTAGKGMIWGFARDALTGEGLYGAEVKFVDTEDTEFTETTGQGGFYAKELDPDTYQVIATLLGYGDSAGISEALADGETVRLDFFLVPDEDSATVYGFVTDLTTGNVIPGTLVAIGNYEAVTDGSGYYRRKGIAPGSYEVAITKSGYEDGAGGLVVAAEEVVRADWGLVPTATPTGTIAVTVEDDNSTALSGARIEVVGVGVRFSDQNGQGTFSGLPAGSYVVVATLEGYYPNAETAVVVADATTDVTITLAAVDEGEQLGWLWGLVRKAADGDPLNAATVAVQGDAHPDNAKSDTSDAAGFYLIADLRAGAESVEASCAGYHTQSLASIPISAGTGTRLDIALVADTVPLGDMGSISGLVYDAADYSMVQGAQVTLDILRMAYSSAYGEFGFEQVAAGTHDLEGTATGFYPTHIANVPVSASEVTYCDLALFRQVRLGTLIVVAVDENEALLDGVTVHLSPTMTGETDSTGTATFTDIPEGWYAVIGSKPSYIPGTVLAQVAAGMVVSCLLRLTAQDPADTAGFLIGHVIDQYTRMGLRLARVAAVDGVGAETDTGSLGAFTLELAPDTYDVTGSKDDYASRTIEAVEIATRTSAYLLIPLLPVDEDDGDLFVGLPKADQIPEGGPSSVLLDYPEDAEWKLAVSVNGNVKWRRAQRVLRGIETTIEQTGEEVRILAKKVNGQITPPGASLRP